MKKIITLILVALSFVFILGCAQNIEDVTKQENIGKMVTVSGTVGESIKIGELSGYILRDENGDLIAVASDTIPNEDEEVRVSGTLKELPVLGYYIDTNE